MLLGILAKGLYTVNCVKTLRGIYLLLAFGIVETITRILNRRPSDHLIISVKDHSSSSSRVELTPLLLQQHQESCTSVSNPSQTNQ
jgi:hypothetical protein